MAAHDYVIWSYEHEAWWAPRRQGYTPRFAEAGDYTAKEAGEIVTDSIFLEEIAILRKVALTMGLSPNYEPTFHPYLGPTHPKR